MRGDSIQVHLADGVVDMEHVDQITMASGRKGGDDVLVMSFQADGGEIDRITVLLTRSHVEGWVRDIKKHLKGMRKK